MPLLNRGLLSLIDSTPTTVTLPADPKIYEPTWPKRISEHQGIGLSVTIQDFGFTIKDKKLRLASGDTQFIDTVTLQKLLDFYLVQGATYRLIDWLDNDFTVYIANFSWKWELVDLYTYTMDLSIRAAAKLYGRAYTGG